MSVSVHDYSTLLFRLSFLHSDVNAQRMILRRSIAFFLSESGKVAVQYASIIGDGTRKMANLGEALSVGDIAAVMNGLAVTCVSPKYALRSGVV